MSRPWACDSRACTQQLSVLRHWSSRGHSECGLLSGLRCRARLPISSESYPRLGLRPLAPDSCIRRSLHQSTRLCSAADLDGIFILIPDGPEPRVCFREWRFCHLRNDEVSLEKEAVCHAPCSGVITISLAGLGSGEHSRGELHRRVSFAPPGLDDFRLSTHGLRRGLHSFAASRLGLR
jgi:hypothetical protein